MGGHPIHPLINYFSHGSTHSDWASLLVDFHSPFNQQSFLVDPSFPHFNRESFWSIVSLSWSTWLKVTWLSWIYLPRLKFLRSNSIL
jgi:hypothetical protein